MDTPCRSPGALREFLFFEPSNRDEAPIEGRSEYPSLQQGRELLAELNSTFGR
jgi:hypothetical protein